MSSEVNEDTGIVTAVNGNCITVEIAKGGGCSSCAMKGLCGSGNKPIILHFETDGSYKTGDMVIVEVASSMRILSSLIVFILPLLAMFAFYLIANLVLGYSEGASIKSAFLGFLIALLNIRFLDRIIGKKIKFSLGGKQ
jgi:positive regulator of sigma E activity